MVNVKKDIIKFHTLRGTSVNHHWLMSSYPPHYHSAGEIALAYVDDCRYKVDNEEITLNKGDILLVWPNDIHETISISRDSSLVIHYEAGLIENNLDILSTTDELYKIHKIDSSQDRELASALAGKMHEIRDLYDNLTTFSETRCKALMTEMIIMIGEDMRRKQAGKIISGIESDTEREHIQAAIAYVSEHFKENISQGDIASHIGLSTYYFSRVFKKNMNMSISEYLTKLRLEFVTTILSETDFPVTECAFAAGFQSITAFNKAFKDAYSCSPRDYRKAAKSGNN